VKFSTADKMLKNFKIETKFNWILTLVFIGSIFLGGAVLSSVLQQKAEDEVTSDAMLLIQTMSSVRNYTDSHIDPLLEPRVDTEPVFTPELVPAYSAIEIFEDLRKNERYKDFFYREPTLNPSNLRDKPDSFETKLVERFINEPGTKEISGFRNLPEGKVFYLARPLTVTKESCLRCHSTPAAAPKTQLATYGTENGFGWKLNQIIAAQMITVPADKVFANARQSLYLFMGILIGIFALVVFLINFLLKRSVIQPIRKMAKMAQEVSTGKISSDFPQKSNDEIGVLAAAFNRMKSSLEIALNLLNQQKN